MKPTWEQIVDYARGIAVPDIVSAVEADPDAMTKASQMHAVHEAGREEAPELWKLRAKALLVGQDRTIPLLFGKLIPSPAGLMGLRSTASKVDSFRFEFDGALLDVRTEFDVQADKVFVAGVFETEEPVDVRVGTESEWLTSCDEDGQFSMHLDQSRTLQFHVLQTNQIFRVEIPNES